MYAQMLIVVQAGRWVRCWLSRYHGRISEEALDIRLQKVGLRDAMRLIHITKPSRTQHPQHTRPPRQETISLQQHNCDNGKEKKTSNKCFTKYQGRTGVNGTEHQQRPAPPPATPV